MPSVTWQNLPAAKRERVLAAARAEFARRGFEPGSLNVIAATAGVSKGSLFQYFTDKTDLYQAVIDENAARVAANTIGLVELDQPLFDVIADLVPLWLSYFDANPESRAISQLSSAEPDPEIRERSRRVSRSEFTAALVPLIERATMVGDLRPEIPTGLVLSAITMVLRHLRTAAFERSFDPGFAWATASPPEVAAFAQQYVDMLRTAFGPTV